MKIELIPFTPLGFETAPASMFELGELQPEISVDNTPGTIARYAEPDVLEQVHAAQKPEVSNGHSPEFNLGLIVKTCAAYSDLHERAEHGDHLTHNARIKIAQLGIAAGLRTEVIIQSFKGQNGYDVNKSTYQVESLRKKHQPPSCAKICEEFNKCNGACAPIMAVQGRSPVDLLKLGEGWNPIVPIDHNRLPKFPVELLPEPLASMATELAIATETPIELTAPNIIGAAVTAANGKYEVVVKDGYTELMVLWILSAMESGNRKTAVVNAAFKPIWDVECEATAQAAPKIKQIEATRRSKEAFIASMRKKIHTKKSEDDREAFIQEITRHELALPVVPTPTKLTVSEATTEGLVVAMVNNGGMISIVSDEASLLETAVRYTKGAPPFLDPILQGHTGQVPIYSLRASREPIVIEMPGTGICISPQPSVIEALGAKTEFKSRGFMARFMFFIPESRLGFRTGDAAPVRETTKMAYAKRLRDILEIECPDRSHTLLKLKFSDEARVRFHDIWLKIERQLRPDGSLFNLPDWGSKLSGQIVRLSGLFHLVEHVKNATEIPIAPETVTRAAAIVRASVPHALRAFNLLEPDEAAKWATKIVQWLKYNKKMVFTLNECQVRFKRRGGKAKELDPTFALLIECNYIRELKLKGKVKHRPAKLYSVNPELFIEQS